MARDLKLQVVLAAIDKATKPIRGIMDSSAGLAKSLKQTRDTLKGLQSQQKDISSFRTLKGASRKSADALKEQQDKVRELARQMGTTGTASKKLRGEFDAAVRKSRSLKEKHAQHRSELQELRNKLGEAGISTSNLSEHERKLKGKIDSTNKSITEQFDRLKRLNDQRGAMQAFKGAAADVGGAAGRVGSQGRRLAAQGAIAGAAGGYFFKTQFLDRAAEFEKFNTILKTVTGSEQKAAEAMSWVSDFAARTPFELAEVLESFTKLKAYGIDPVADGLLKTLGDTASAMGKPVMQAVEAIADAVTGENERLKEFGIKGSKSGGLITYEYTNAAGDTLTKSVDSSNRKLIQSTLQAIWNEKYNGAMEEQSRTWNGMISNLSDQWARFTNMIMGAGLFDRMREHLDGLLDRVNTMAANGQLAAWAERIGKGMLRFADGAWEVGKALVEVSSSIADAVGGWKNLLYILAALKLAPLIISILALGKALFFAGKALFALGMANPVVAAIIIIIGLLAGAAYLIYKYWEPISGFFKDLWAGISAVFSSVWAEIKAGVNGGIGGVSALILNWSPLGLFYKTFAGVMNYFGHDLPGKFTDFGSNLISGLVNGIMGKIPSIKGAIDKVGEYIPGWFADKLGIRSPSRVFAQLGDDTMAGLKVGLDRSQQGPLSSILKAGKTLAGAGVIALGVGGGTPALAVDNRAPLSASAPAAGAPVYNINVNVSAQPGMNEGALARLVAQEIQRATQAAQARQRSALQDNE